MIYDLVGFTLEFIEAGHHYDFWEIDFDAIDNDENWNNPKWKLEDAHLCHGYDTKALRRAIETANDSGKWFTFFCELVPAKFVDQVSELRDHPQFNMYEEWNIV